MRRFLLTLALLPIMAVSANAQSQLVGDANGDGKLDISDVVFLVTKILDNSTADENTAYLQCPDNHHPHLIDLGLPSGTKWSCCNVDATAPEAFGGYYAWGETEEKDVYNLGTYRHYDSTNHYHDLGANISGTKYDVAHTKWGGDWRMPSITAFDEMRANCTIEWTQVKGVNGLKITGKNGGSIFLSASGCYTGSEFKDDGLWGYYWSSCISSAFPDLGTSVITATEEGAKWYELNRYHGFSVRPIQIISSCDFNRDGSIDINDVVNVVNRILNGSNGYYACPDDHHPHAIDLGLPSGTKWACCNVGAATPQSSGSYFAWGETETKNWYDESNYIHCDDHSMNHCHDLGSSIIGTEYDVASEKWGSSWQMPSLAQTRELINKCSSEWIELDNFKGYKFIGPNGSCIYLPAAGYYSDEPPTYGEDLLYWIGEMNTSRMAFGYTLVFTQQYGLVLAYQQRCYGFSVRPVASK